MNYENNKIEAALVKAFEEIDLDEKSISDAVFHMTDWLDDLRKLNELYAKPESFTAEEASKLLMQFLVHAPEHIAAASKLVTGFPVADTFKIGATTEGKSG